MIDLSLCTFGELRMLHQYAQNMMYVLRYTIGKTFDFFVFFSSFYVF